MGEAKSPMEVNELKWDRINDPVDTRCADCDGIYRSSELECGVCESCWSKRDAGEAQLDAKKDSMFQPE